MEKTCFLSILRGIDGYGQTVVLNGKDEDATKEINERLEEMKTNDYAE